MLISEEYRSQNRKLHRHREAYGRSGGGWAKAVIGLTEHFDTKDVLDYGCGKGELAKKLPIPVREYDPAIDGKDVLPEPADIVVCTDVLEHIEPEYLEAVLDHLQSLVRVCGFFTIATRKAKKILPDGRNAHLIVQPADWWLGHLQHRFKVVRWDVDERQKGEVITLVKRRRE